MIQLILILLIIISSICSAVFGLALLGALIITPIHALILLLTRSKETHE